MTGNPEKRPELHGGRGLGEECSRKGRGLGAGEVLREGVEAWMGETKAPWVTG